MSDPTSDPASDLAPHLTYSPEGVALPPTIEQLLRLAYGVEVADPARLAIHVTPVVVLAGTAHPLADDQVAVLHRDGREEVLLAPSVWRRIRKALGQERAAVPTEAFTVAMHGTPVEFHAILHR